MVNAPANIGQNWSDYKKIYRKAVIDKLSNILKTDIEPLIVTEEMLDPVTIESKTASYMGSLYGTSSNSRLAAFYAIPIFQNLLKVCILLEAVYTRAAVFPYVYAVPAL